MGLFSSAVHKFNYDMAPFGGYPLFNVNPQQYSSPYSITCYHSAPSTIFAPGRSFCLPSHIRPKCRNFGPLMECWEGHYMGFNHKLQFHRFLILEVWVCLQSLTRQESKKRQDHHSMDCNTKVQFQTFRIVVVMVYQPTPPSHKSQYYVPRMGRLVRHCVKSNRTFHFRLYLLIFIFIIEIIFIKSFGDKNSVVLQSDLFCFRLK